MFASALEVGGGVKALVVPAEHATSISNGRLKPKGEATTYENIAGYVAA